MVSGTDGNDFYHRETIAGHYKSSVVNKGRLKLLMFLHFMLVLLMTFRLSTFFFVMAEMRPPSFFQQLQLPRPQMWEFVWLVTVLPVFFGYVAIRKNRVFLLQQYLIGTFVFGVLSSLYAIYSHFEDLLEYWETKTATEYYKGYPVIVMWYMFLMVAMQLHIAEIYFSYLLLKAWKPEIKKKVK